MTLQIIVWLAVCVSCSTAWAGPNRREASAANKRAAEEYCKAYTRKYPDRACRVDVRVCPKGWRADKKFKGKGTNYSACVKGKKSERANQVLSNLGTQDANRGSAELVNTRYCSAEGIEYINASVQFLRNSWSAIRREAERPTRTSNSGYSGTVVKAISVRERQWKKITSRIFGPLQVHCDRDPEKCKTGVNYIQGYNGSKRRYVTLCGNNLWERLPPENVLKVTASVLLHEIAHDAKFPMDRFKKHNCVGEWEARCPYSDETYQLGHAAVMVYEKSTTRKTMRRRPSKHRKTRRRSRFKGFH